MYQHMKSLSLNLRESISTYCVYVAFILAGVQNCFAQEITEQIEANAEAEHAARLVATMQELGYGSLSNRRVGDLDTMEKSRVIRVLTVYGLGQYYLDGVEQKGATYELFSQFES